MAFATSVLALTLSVLYQLMNLILNRTVELKLSMLDVIIFSICVAMLIVTHGKVTCMAKAQRIQIEATKIQGSAGSGNIKRKGKKILDRATVMMLVVVGVFLL